MKHCPRCNKTKEDSEFYKRNNGYLRSHCIECTKKQHKKYNKTYTYKKAKPRSEMTEEEVSESRKLDKYYRQKTREARNARHQAYKKRNRHKMKAHRLVAEAIEEGTLQRPDTCSKCGKAGIIEGHHEDYSLPLDVVWLCTGCHGARHSEIYQERLANKSD